MGEKANDVQAFADAYLAILGAPVDDEGITRIRDDRVINFFGTDDAKDILVQFLLESIVLSCVGGLIGVACGVGGALIVGNIQKWPILITESSIAISFTFSALVGIFFGFYPAWRASRLNPIDCLRYE